jgi:hypothetical protein
MQRHGTRLCPLKLKEIGQVDEEILREVFSNKQGLTSKDASDHL